MSQLQEITKVRQVRGEPRRRWFQSDDLDLIVWCGPADEPLGFQLCYDRGDDEHAVTWTPDTGLVHERVDDGESARVGSHKATPILVPDGTLNYPRLRHLLAAEGTSLPPELYEFVRARLHPSREARAA